MKTANDIRRAFLDYFVKQGHTEVSSSPLVPQNDPTLMFANSGMVQFKNLFTGAETREYARATTAQKSVRAGGKHNDLENVGYTARHHTFFEMMGNFSFGDYFKSEAIPFAWEMVTGVLGLPKDRLLVTVFAEDDEAFDIWKKVAGFSDDKIIRIATSDNFWQMGDTGPCGPCTEIFFDHGDHIEGGPPGSPDEDGDRFVEIWNLVFMQYEQFADGSRKPLPKPSIDTGMGLERVAAIMQGSHDNYDIDLLRRLIEQVADITSTDPDGDQKASHRVIADHLRASAFLMADGVMPSNEGRGYVLRRIMRRGMRHAHLLGAQDPLMHKMVPTLTAMMGEAYPELKRAEAMVTEMLDLEETRFKGMLDRGLKLLDAETADLKAGESLPGETAFKLYDTFGFPVDLTQDALKAQNIGVDMKGFEKAMEAQRAQARANWKGSGEEATESLWFDLLDRVAPTEFLGYTQEEAEAQIVALVKDGAETDTLKAGDHGFVIVNQSPFYAESGGQVGDQGVIESEGGGKARVRDVKKKAGKLWAHEVTVENGTLSVGEAADLAVDHARRASIRVHHSVTHLLHEALRQKLGDHIAQKGSLQGATRTRFDISHPKAISAEELAEIETQVNREILANSDVTTRVLPLEEAMESGARALFGEKYDDEVRVVSMGTIAAGAKHPFSVELCGGTHVMRTGDIGLFKIISESAVSAGVRRVEALAGETALAYLREQETRVKDLATLLKTTPTDVQDRVQALLEERKKLEQELATARKKLAMGGGAAGEGGAANDAVKDIGGVKFAGRVLDGVPAKDLKGMVDEIKGQIGSGVVVLVATNEGKASLVVGVTSDLTAKYNAVDLVRTGAEALGGKGGGGRPDMAQAGGPDAEAANDAVEAIAKVLR